MLDHNIAKRTFEQMLLFRAQMNDFLYQNKAEEIFGESKLKEIILECKGTDDFRQYYRIGECKSEIVNSKVNIVKQNINKLLVFNWVKYVAVTGSVAAGIAQENDDIDIFVVVEDNRLWIYRLMIWLKNFGGKRFRRQSLFRHAGLDVKDKICMNFLVEERGLCFEEDIFVLHELFYMEPIFHEDYKKRILSENKWISEKFGTLVPDISKQVNSKDSLRTSFSNIFIRIVNLFCFTGQLAYMSLHKPNYAKLISNYKKGRAEFFHDDRFKAKIIENLIK